MPSDITLLVVVSAFLHAAWNTVLKRRPDPEIAVVGVLAVAGVSSGLVAVLMHVPVPGLESLAWCLAAGVVETAYFVTLARALNRAPLGPVYTIVRGGALLVVWPVSVAFLGEQVTPLIMLGTLLVVGGLGTAGSSEARATSAFEADRERDAAHVPTLEALEHAIPRPPRLPLLAMTARVGAAGHLPAVAAAPGARSGKSSYPPGMRRSAPSFADATELPSFQPLVGKGRFRWAMVCAVFAALYQIGYKMALVKGGKPEMVVALTMITASLVQLAYIGQRGRSDAVKELREAPLAIVGAGLLATLSFVLFVRAMAHGGAGLLTTLRNTSILFAQGLAVLSGERPKRLAIIGAVLVTFGAVLLSF